MSKPGGLGVTDPQPRLQAILDAEGATDAHLVLHVGICTRVCSALAALILLFTKAPCT